MTAPIPIVLVPGFWLGAWAWDEVVGHLDDAGHRATAITLPGLEPDREDRGSVTMADHVDAIVSAVEAAGDRVVLAVHSGAGVPGYQVTDRIPERIAAMVYVDTGPATGPLNGDFADDVWEFPGIDTLQAEENLDGLSDAQLARFADLAVAEPGNAVRGFLELSNDARRAVPSTVICTGFTGEQYREALAEGYAFVGGLGELTDVTYIDLPTSHWPMWSRPSDLAEVLGDIASTAE